MEEREIEIFSTEERDDINARIEAASAREAVTAPGIPSKEQVSRRGLFPLLVNAGAVLLLAAGIFLLFSFQKTGTAKIRESGTVLGVTERALISEIRSEAKSLLGEKDNAINAMNERISDVDAELTRLASLETLTDEQRDAMAELILKQEEYRESLARMQIDRAKILTNARIREAEARRRDENLSEQRGIGDGEGGIGKAEMDSAREELAKLSGDAEKTALIEKQLSSFYSAISNQIESRQFKQAESSIASLKEYLATPAFASIKTVQARHDSDIAALNALSFLLSEAQIAGAGPAAPIKIEELPAVAPGPGAEETLRKQVASQAASLAEQNAAIATMNKNLEDLKKNISDLQLQNNTFKLNIEEREKQLESLKSQNASYAQTIETLQRTISNVNAALENRQNQRTE